MYSIKNTLIAIAGITLAAPTALAQTAPTFDSRYTAPTEAAPAMSAALDEPLISYRRDDVANASAPATSVDRLPSPAAASPADANRNPLREAPEPPPMQQPAPIEMAPIPDSVSQPSTNPFGNPAAPPQVAQFPVASSPAPLAAELPVAAPAPATSEPIFRYDSAVLPAANQVEAPRGTEATPVASSTDSATDLLSRRLAPPSTESSDGSMTTADSPQGAKLPFAFSQLESFSTAGAGLAIVVGLFLICMWMLRRGGAKPSGALPSDAFAVLGRAPLTAQSFAHLLRLGNKLVLVAMSPEGIQPLTEVTDPMEVDRLTGLCASGRGYGPTAEFQQVLSQLSREPARGFLGAEAPSGGRHR